MEVNAIGTFWKSIGDAMDIEYKGYLSKDSWKDGIEFAEDITAWAKSYEVEAMKPAKTNRALCQPLLDMLIHLVPQSFKAVRDRSRNCSYGGSTTRSILVSISRLLLGSDTNQYAEVS